MTYIILVLFLFFKKIIKAQTSIALIWTGIFYFAISFFYYFLFKEETVKGEAIIELLLALIMITIGMITYGIKKIINKPKVERKIT